jgi:hypothetical protein
MAPVTISILWSCFLNIREFSKRAETRSWRFAAAFGGLVALMYLMQRSLMYFPERLHTPPVLLSEDRGRELVLDALTFNMEPTKR